MSALIAGDFNQPNEPDYPPREWVAISQDLDNAKLPHDDGVMTTLLKSGFAPSFSSTCPYPPGSSCWTSNLVDYMYFRANEDTWYVKDAWVYYTSCSDHFPLVTDYMCRRV